MLKSVFVWNVGDVIFIGMLALGFLIFTGLFIVDWFTRKFHRKG